MTAFLRENEGRSPLIRYGRYTLDGISLPEVVLPKIAAKQPKRTAERLRKAGVRRFLPIGGWSGQARLRAFLPEVTPLPLYRALTAELLLTRVEHIPPRERRVALRGERVDGCARLAAEALCPKVGTLILDFRWGGEELAEELNRRFGVAPLTELRGEPPHGVAELSPCGASIENSIKLWGEPNTEGAELVWERPVPREVPAAEWLTFLWEAGRLPLSELRVRMSQEG